MVNRCSGWLPGICYSVARVFWVVGRTLVCDYMSFLSNHQDVAVRLSATLLCDCFESFGCLTMWLLGCCGQLPVGYNVAARLFWVVARMLLCDCTSLLDECCLQNINYRTKQTDQSNRQHVTSEL